MSRKLFSAPFTEPQPPGLRFVTVDSLQPVFRWEPFVPPIGKKPASELRLTGYDLRVWRMDEGSPGELVYRRNGLAQPEHRMEFTLLPHTAYCWSIRPRFDLNGQPRVGNWSFSKKPRFKPGLLDPFEMTRGDAEQIPDANYFRFITP